MTAPADMRALREGDAPAVGITPAASSTPSSRCVEALDVRGYVGGALTTGTIAVVKSRSSLGSMRTPPRYFFR